MRTVGLPRVIGWLRPMRHLSGRVRPVDLLAALLLPAAGASLTAAPPASASPTAEPAAVAAATPDLAAVAREPQWLRLLHYGRADRPRSQINSPDFFLSPQGSTDPLAELQATLQAWHEPWTDDTDSHPRCRFPARYWWLAQRLDLPGYTPREARCRKLERWWLFDKLRSASLLLVSGYFGNPASTFGHSLLRLNTSAPGADNLLDVSINYGALIPDGELTVVYVFKGLFGGYQAGFSDKHFYTQDLVYSRTEFRDIWDYELNLTPDQLRLLAFHLWETIGRKFDYYFLTENCAYRQAELLELVTGRRLLDRSRVWFVPVEMFHRLNTLDAERAPGEPPLVRSVRFVPSSQRVLYDRFARMGAPAFAAANRVIAQGASAVDNEAAALPEDARTEFVDALLAYAQYRLVAEAPAETVPTRALKDELLRARLALPVQQGPGPAVLEMASPADGTAPMLTGAGLGRESGAREFARLHWAAFLLDQAGVHGLDGELVVAEIAVGAERGGRVFLDRFDAIRARKLSAHRFGIHGEDDSSWQLRIGSERERRNGRDQYALAGAFGIGRAVAVGRSLTSYAMLDGVLRTGDINAGLEPNVGLVAKAGPWRGWAQAGMRYETETGRWHARGEAVLRYRLAQHRLLSVEFRRAYGLSQAVAALNLYW